jgi:hypothetical protein
VGALQLKWLDDIIVFADDAHLMPKIMASKSLFLAFLLLLLRTD